MLLLYVVFSLQTTMASIMVKVLLAIFQWIIVFTIIDASVASASSYYLPVPRPIKPYLYDTDTILPLPIENNVSAIFRFSPSRKHMKKKRLITLLGKNFNSDYMSVERPTSEADAIIDNDSQNNDIKLLSDARQLNFSFIDEDGVSLDLDQMTLDALHHWLVRKSVCRVQYTWEDIGALFWPRWVKRGMCVTDQPCSWPPGMHCVPAESRTIFILRWHCTRKKKNRFKNILNRARRGMKSRTHKRRRRRPRKWKGKMKCNWLRVPYPLTDECFCSC